jgi:hypothetical protein
VQGHPQRRRPSLPSPSCHPLRSTTLRALHTAAAIPEESQDQPVRFPSYASETLGELLLYSNEPTKITYLKVTRDFYSRSGKHCEMIEARNAESLQGQQYTKRLHGTNISPPARTKTSGLVHSMSACSNYRINNRPSQANGTRLVFSASLAQASLSASCCHATGYSRQIQ